MKLYYFVIITIGLMYMFSVAGIDTASSRILDKLTDSNITDTNVNPDVSDYSSSSSESILDSLNQNWWVIFAIALAVLIFVGVISGIRVFGSGVDITAVVYTVSAALSAFLFFMFAVDFFSILLYMNEITGGTGWQFHLTWILIVPILFGFALSLIQFIKGTE